MTLVPSVVACLAARTRTTVTTPCSLHEARKRLGLLRRHQEQQPSFTHVDFRWLVMKRPHLPDRLAAVRG